jgi:hypothetical protein
VNSTIPLRRLGLLGALLAVILAAAALSGGIHPRLAKAEPDTRLTVKVSGPVGVPWAGTVKNGQGLNASWADWGIDATSVVGSVTGVDPVNFLVSANQPPAAGWLVVGYAVFESTDPNPACPVDPQAYQSYGLVYLGPSQPAWAVCVKVAQAEPLPGSYLEVRVNSQYGPTGWVDGPGDMDFSWFSMGLESASSSGGREDVPAAVYTVIGDNPPLPGLVIQGYYAMETNDPTIYCPQDPSVYTTSGGTVEISAQHPIWRVCVHLVTAPPQPDPEPEPQPQPQPADPGPEPEPFFPDPGLFDPWWFDTPSNDSPQDAGDTPNPGTPTPAAGNLGGTSTPDPQGTPTAAAPVSSPEPSTTPDPVGQGQQGGASGASPTPIAPRTGNAAVPSGGQTWWFSVAGLLMALSAGAVAAGQIPGRRKR